MEAAASTVSEVAQTLAEQLDSHVLANLSFAVLAAALACIESGEPANDAT
jgi:hypothetical protein